MTLPNDDWEEIEPCVFQRKKYTQEQIDMLSRRPDKMIRDALDRSPLSSPQ